MISSYSGSSERVLAFRFTVYWWNANWYQHSGNLAVSLKVHPALGFKIPSSTKQEEQVYRGTLSSTMGNRATLEATEVSNYR